MKTSTVGSLVQRAKKGELTVGVSILMNVKAKLTTATAFKKSASILKAVKAFAASVNKVGGE